VTLGVAAQVMIPWESRSRRMRFRLTLVDGDGGQVKIATPLGESALEIAGQFEVVPVPGTPPGSELPFVAAFNVTNLPLQPGTTFEWQLFIENETEPSGRASFAVRAAQFGTA